MSFLNDLVTGVAELLADSSIGLTWQPSGAYAAGATGIFIMAVPASPNRLVTLSAFVLSDDASLSDSEIGLQIRSRSAGADPRDVYTLDDSIAGVLLGNYPLTLPTGIRIVTLIRSSATPLGQDDRQRFEWASSYTLQVHRPSTHRT